MSKKQSDERCLGAVWGVSEKKGVGRGRKKKLAVRQTKAVAAFFHAATIRKTRQVGYYVHTY
jgi:hypothetical protein